MNILTVNLVLSTLIFWIAARVYLLPRLHEFRPQAILLPMLFLHSFRHLGLMFLAPGKTYAGIPPQFAYPAAYGDLVAAIFALVSIAAVAVGDWSAWLLLWVFNVEGLLVHHLHRLDHALVRCVREIAKISQITASRYRSGSLSS